MLKFLLLIGIWSLITALFYKLGKLLLSNLSERKLIEIIGSQLFTRKFLPQYNILEGWQYLFLTICFFSFLGGSYFVAFGLIDIQTFFFNTPTGHFIGHDIYLFFIVSFGISLAILLLITLYFLRKAPEIPLTKWDTFPSLREILYRVRAFKNIGFGISLVLQSCFLFGMMDYIIIEKDSIVRNSIGSFIPETIPMSAVKSANLTFRYQSESSTRSSSSRKVLKPLFHINLEEEYFNIWNQSLSLSDSVIEQTAFALNEKFIPITIDYPGVMERVKWRTDLAPSKSKQIIGIYDYVTRLSKGISKPISIGKEVTVQNLKIQLDSAVYSNRANIFSYTQKKPLLVYFTVTNEATDSTFFGTLLDLKIIDKNEKSYTQSMAIENIGDSHIPPKQTVIIMRGFRVPKEGDNLKLRYVLSSFNKQYVEFDL